MGHKCVSTVVIYLFNKHGEQVWIRLTECCNPVPIRKKHPNSGGKNTTGNCCIIKSLINFLIQGKFLHCVSPTSNGFFVVV